MQLISKRFHPIKSCPPNHAPARRRTWLSLLLFVLVSLPACVPTGQVKGVRQFEIPFEYENGFIVVQVFFNDFFPLRFIFDTGAEHTILTRREITDMLQVDYQRRFTIMGADLTTELTAYLVTGIKLRLNSMQANNRSILVLEEDYFHIDEYAGVEVQGILGADLFRRFVVQINYERRVINLFSPEGFEPPGGRFREVPIEMVRNKPYLYADTYIQSDTSIRAKYLIDTGAALGLLLYTDTHPGLDLPERVVRGKLGIGLGGEIQGFVGRVHLLNVAGFEIEDVVADYHDVRPDIDSTYLNDRNGIVGNQVLSRFNLVIDYVRNRCYLAPNRQFNRKFRYDRSGLLLAAGGPNLNEYNIFDVVPGSPAAEAGVRPGDRLLTINGWPASLISLEAITNKLRKAVGKRIRLTVERDGERRKVAFQLRELI